mmetsp:Transcript_30505/g.40583  ORF Transcript_30505/g.40583 Transcript_30505/m.40583 type:complete len:104 (-) Transcript_30505:3048-3359(-)
MVVEVPWRVQGLNRQVIIDLKSLAMLDTAHSLAQVGVSSENLLFKPVPCEQFVGCQVIGGALIFFQHLDGLGQATKVVKVPMCDQNAIELHIFILGQIVSEID